MSWIKPVQINAAVLTAFAIATGALIAGTYLGTKDTIKHQERLAQAKALLEIMPATTHDNELVDDFIWVSDKDLLNLSGEQQLYVARKNGKVNGVIIPAVAPDGYSGNIDVITGINSDGSVAGVRVVAHNETPGLGDKVETKKSDWIYSFNGKSLTNLSDSQWKVKKDKGVFDQFTGATITPRAVVKAVHNTLNYYDQNQVTILQQANTAEKHEAEHVEKL